MPRYRFSWDNLPADLLRQLGRDLKLRPPVDEALRARYGARPRPEFVRDAWPTLIDAWLAADRDSRELVVEELLDRRLGSAALPPRSAVAQLKYLRTCRNSVTLRKIVAAIFTAYGESESVDTPVPSETTAQDNPIVTPDRADGARPGAAGDSPQPPTSLHGWLGWAVAQVLDVDEVDRDPDGDIRIRYGSTMCFVRSIADPPSVRLFAPMVVEVLRTPALLEALNDINLNITVGRVFHTPANEVLFALELYGEQLTVEIIRASLDAATSIADHFDHQLQARFGGKTMFAEVNDDSVMV
jgi:Putative bacterial sensory transduction regulator